MFYTHHFAHHETLSRAHSWLTRLGFRADRPNTHTEGIPRLTLSVEPSRLAEVVMLLNAVERSDPEGWPSFWENARKSHPGSVTHECTPTPEAARPKTVPIGWHPVDKAPEPLLQMR